ncbi:MAG: DoxX family protein, partial [Bryobacteraceae bacterium]
LAWAKLLGVAVLLAPVPARLKEWAYAGVFFEMTGAAASWIATGDKTGQFITPLIFVVFAMASWALRPPARILGSVLPLKLAAHGGVAPEE